MRFLKVLVVLPLWLLLVADASPAATPTPSPPPPPPSPSPSPVPTPTPTAAFLSLDVSAGGANQVINVSGSSFLPGEKMSLFWDSANKVIGSATADGNGNFANVAVKPFAGDPPGLHKICASVPPQPCAQFELQGTPTPTPSPPPSPSESPSPDTSPTPSESPTATATPTPIPLPATSDTNNLDALFQPPFIFLPFIAALGLIGAIAYWVLGSKSRRPSTLPSAAIFHRSVRPEAGLPGIEYVPPPLAATPPPPPEDAPQPPWPAPNPRIEDDPSDPTLPKD